MKVTTSKKIKKCLDLERQGILLTRKREGET